jgi:hypothetical protein
MGPPVPTPQEKPLTADRAEPPAPTLTVPADDQATATERDTGGREASAAIADAPAEGTGSDAGEGPAADAAGSG